MRARWLGHSSVLVSGPNSPTIAVDPWRWRLEDVRADVVLVTHGHADHCSEDDIAQVMGRETTILCPAVLAERLGAAFPNRAVGLAEGDTFEQVRFRVMALPHEGPARAAAFHPRGRGLSWLLETGGARHLFLGDSTALPEHEGLTPDVAWIAVGGLAVMDPQEAADAAARIRPGVAVPVHWGDLNGRFELAATFATLCAARGVRALAKPPKE